MALPPSPVLAASNAETPFWIRAVDDETGRGVPLVKLTTTDRETFVTDSHGIAAITASGLRGETVWFSVDVEGYRFPRKDFGGRPGFRTRLESGDSTVIRLKRENVAERLYRKTGRGIYADSLRVGLDVPFDRSGLNAGIMGQDSALGGVFRGRIHWIYGDSRMPDSRFGVFEATGATSRLPSDGGLPPDRGIRQRYFTDRTGRAKPLMPQPGPGPIWLSRLMVIRTEGEDRLYAHYVKIRSGGHFDAREHGIARWFPQDRQFRPARRFPLDRPYRVNNTSSSHRNTIRVREDGKTWFYFANPYPTLKVPARVEALLDPEAYRVFSPLVSGSRPEGAPLPFQRDENGRLQWGWKQLTDPLPPARENKLVEDGRLRPSEGIHHLTDVQTGERLVPGHGSVHWNPYRQQWIMIAPRRRGSTSNLGEVYYAEADSLLGPWVHARKIVTHDSHTLYNPNHHPFLDQARGRYIYFEGTYSSSFNASTQSVPRYNYNQIMYRLDLSDTRLILPTPIYRVPSSRGSRYHVTPPGQAAHTGKSTIPFYAYGPDRHPEESVPVRERTRRIEGETVTVLTRRRNPSAADTPAFFALPEPRPENPGVEPLYEYRSVRGSDVTYTTPSRDPGFSWRRVGEPLAYVWVSPRTDPPRNPGARPVLTCRGSSAHCPSGAPEP